MKTNLADIKSSTINMLIGILVLLTLIKTMFSPPKGNKCLPFTSCVCTCIYSFSLSTEKKKKNQALMLIADALALLKTMLVLQWASAKNNHNSSPVLTRPF